MRAAILFNPSPRWNEELPNLAADVENFSAIEKQVFEVSRTEPDSLEVLLEEILKQPFDAIAVAGGDGSLNRTVNFLRGKNRLEKSTLAVIPLGTCNDFAKTMGLPAGRPGPALSALARGKTRRVSIAAVNGHAFINNSGFGRREPDKKRKSALGDLLDLKPIRVRASCDGKPLEGDFLMMVCANAPYFSNGLCFSRSSDPSDGSLEFFFVNPMSKLGLSAKFILGRMGRPLSRYPKADGAVVAAAGGGMALETDEPIWIMTDGEVVPKLSGIRQAAFEIAGSCKFITA